MALELRQQLRLTQQLVMTPQLQQAIKLLQLNQLELVNLVQQELQENPVLEESDVDEETEGEREDATPEDYDEAGSESATSADDRADAANDSEIQSTVDAMAEGVQPPDEPPVAGEEVAPSDAEKIADIEWESYLESNPMTGLESRGLGDDDRPSIEATYARRPSLAEHLEWQLQVTDLDSAGFEIAKWIIGNIDERGFLRSTVEDLARQANVEEVEVERVLSAIQKLDPIGVAARDLRECLLLQIDAQKIDHGLVRRIVDEYLDLLQKRDFRGLTRMTGVTLQEISDAAQVIGGLEPRPGRGFGRGATGQALAAGDFGSVQSDTVACPLEGVETALFSPAFSIPLCL